jgi:hypothetical protein
VTELEQIVSMHVGSGTIAAAWLTRGRLPGAVAVRVSILIF